MANPVFVPNKWFTVTPSNTVPNPCSVILCDAAGTLAVRFEDGATDTFTVAAGQQIAGRFAFVLSTGTTATGIHGGLY